MGGVVEASICVSSLSPVILSAFLGNPSVLTRLKGTHCGEIMQKLCTLLLDEEHLFGKSMALSGTANVTLFPPPAGIYLFHLKTFPLSLDLLCLVYDSDLSFV